MYGTTVSKACQTPEALVVVTAIPVCESCVSDYGRDQASSPPTCDCALPFRCAAVMDCWEALTFMEGVGDVVF